MTSFLLINLFFQFIGKNIQILQDFIKLNIHISNSLDTLYTKSIKYQRTLSLLKVHNVLQFHWHEGCSKSFRTFLPLRCRCRTDQLLLLFLLSFILLSFIITVILFRFRIFILFSEFSFFFLLTRISVSSDFISCLSSFIVSFFGFSQFTNPTWYFFFSFSLSNQPKGSEKSEKAAFSIFFCLLNCKKGKKKKT